MSEKAGSDSRMNNQSGESSNPNAAVTMFTPVSHPVMKSVDPVQVSDFIKERERYELEVAEKQKELPTLTVSPYTASFDRTLLKNMVMLGEFDAIAPNKAAESLTSDEVKLFIHSFVKKLQEGYDPQSIEKALGGLRMQMHITDPSARVLHFASCFFERLEQIGYGEFCEDNPEKATELMCKHLLQPKLREVISERIEIDKSLKKNLKAFVKIIRKEAISCMACGSHRTPDDNKSSNTSNTAHKSSGASNASGKGKQDDKKAHLQVCLYPPHAEKGLRHRLWNCWACPEDQKDGLISQYKTRKAEKKNKGAMPVPEPCPEQCGNAQKDGPHQDSVTFAATFGGKLHDTLFADIGADANLADQYLVHRIQQAGGNFDVQELVRTAVLSLAVGEGRDGKNINIVCHQTATLNVEMYLRHGSTLMLRNHKWMITAQPMAEPLLGCPTLEILGLNTKEILTAAADRLHGDIDMAVALPETETGGTISRVLHGGIYHSDRGVDCSSADAENEWLDFGINDPQEKRAAIADMLLRASKAGIYAKGLAELKTLVTKFDDIFRLRLGPGPPAKVDPLVIELLPNAKPVRAKQRRYPPGKRRFLNRVVSKLQEFGLIKPTTTAEWVSAPLIVPKPPPDHFRMALDLRAINAATKPMHWPMPNLESETSEMSRNRCFASIEFPSGFWQVPFHVRAQLLNAFMTDAGVFMPTRTSQGGRTSAQNFQAKVSQCFVELQHCLKSWIDDFALHTRTEPEILQALRRFFEICRAIKSENFRAGSSS